MSTLLLNEERIVDALREVLDPELGVNIVDLGLIYGVEIIGNRVFIKMTLTTIGCPLHDSMTAAAERAVRMVVPGVEDVCVEMVFDPPWTPERMSLSARRDLGWGD